MSNTSPHLPESERAFDLRSVALNRETRPPDGRVVSMGRKLFSDTNEPDVAYTFPNGNRLVFDAEGHQVLRFQKRPYLPLPPGVPVHLAVWRSQR
jgi:hypothetical protein